jgi:phosphomannomutase
MTITAASDSDSRVQSGHVLAPELADAANDWIANDPNEATRKEIQLLVASCDEAELRRILLSGRMEFGTAGLRARLGPGYNQMNVVTIAQAAQGFVAYLQEQFDSATLAERGVIVGYDHRHYSDRFAQLTAAACRAADIRVHLTSTICPTPYVAFGVRLLNCVAGVMVTASHNPKEDNGYKVYWSTGSQIIPPHDAGIAAAIERNLKIRDTTIGDLWKSPDVKCPLAEIESRFFGSLSAVCEPHRDVTRRTDLHVTYTAMHGVGGIPTTRAVTEIAGLPVGQWHTTPEQQEPHPDFPTVTFPNPEEGKSALELATKVAIETGSTLIVANDPDADRLALAEVDLSKKTATIFTGNQVGALFGWWCVAEAKRQGRDLSLCIVLSSAVSSQILRSIAEKEGMQFEETLTGFKWMGTRGTIAEETRGLQVLFAFEESIGFMVGDRVRDKDGVSAAAIAVQMAAWLAAKGLTLSQQLQNVFAEYGVHTCQSSYVISPSPATTREMFTAMKDSHGAFPTSIGGCKVIAVRDLVDGTDTRTADGRAALPTSTVSPMITFFFEGDVVLTIRASGTEPKIKYYCEARGTDESENRTRIDAIVKDALTSVVKVEQFGFKPRSH